MIYDELSLWDAPKWCAGFSENPVFKHLLEHPFFFCHPRLGRGPSRIFKESSHELMNRCYLQELQKIDTPIAVTRQAGIRSEER